MENLNEQMVPRQSQGSKMDAVEEREFNTVETANKVFTSACERMLLVHHWGKYSPGTDFRLFDIQGNPVERPAVVGDFIQIDIPGPGTLSGKGYDWVYIEDIQAYQSEAGQSLGMRVRPCKNPMTSGEEVAHFLEDAATSTFIIRREGTQVWAEEHGRNEMVNLGAEKLIDKARNVVVGLSAKIGLSYPQWKMLVKGLLDGSV